MSLYAEYLKERTDDRIIENDKGFITYRRLNDDQMYIMDIYINPECRKKGMASHLADRVCDYAKSMGCKEVIGTVNPSAKGATESLAALIAYGMKVLSSQENCIVFKKDI